MTRLVQESGESGFTLLETLIAFLILSMSLSVTVQTISRGGLTFRRAADIEKANLVMQELSANVVAGMNGPGEFSGKMEFGSWKIVARQIDDNLPGTLLALDVEIRPRDEEGPLFEFKTIATGGNSE